MAELYRRRHFLKRCLSVAGIAICSSFCTRLLGEAGAEFSTERARDAQSFVDSIGVNTHINYFDRLYGNFDLLKQQLEASGIRHVRDGAVLQNDAYNRTVYGRWRTLASFGVKFDVCFDPRGSFKVPTADGIAQVLALAGGAVESIEGPNELDISKKPAWIDVARSYQQALFEAGKQTPAAANLIFIGPSMAFVKNAPRVGDISAYVTHGNLHTYAGGGMPDSLYAKQAAQATAMYGNKPLIVTETGYHNAMHNRGSQPPVSEAAGAKYIPRAYFQAFNAGIERTYLYEFFDEWSDPDQTNQEAHFGLVRNDGTQKPAFVAIRNMISILRDKSNASTTAAASTLSLAMTGETNSLAHTLLCKRDGVYYLALWQEVSSYDTKAQADLVVPPNNVTISFPKAFHKANLYDPLNSSAPVQQWGRAAKYDVQVPDRVIILELVA
jgi:hypothetical protein